MNDNRYSEFCYNVTLRANQLMLLEIILVVEKTFFKHKNYYLFDKIIVEILLFSNSKYPLQSLVKS